MPRTKRCPRCREAKPLEDFARNRTARDGLCSYCRPCWSAYHVVQRRKQAPEVRAARNRRGVLAKHGITTEGYDQMVTEQDGRCAVCGDEPAGSFAIDHDHGCCPGEHSCGTCVRALLCKSCNSALGMLRDDPDRALALAAYLIQRRDVLGEVAAA